MNEILSKLYSVIEDRKNNPIEGSYTNYLFDKGIDKILKKVGEETTEVIIASKDDNKEDLINEMCDVIYHTLVLLNYKNIKLEDIEKELEKRNEKICNKKQERRPIENI
ncbi:phosphoribosyl-ATP diphosphatase [Clostridium felsineum]|uniref:Phosphoribosyl-ATP pyrophosphatase n=1 Tax=Clostridium felsineum TaxID=36839 RepID=A0A1S8LPE7_9CLOT|nr:phosphoribosyl-ATP diphosphatase [Clostridium felsineum]URZ01422.1 Phosphoribosyl-ATP pyrophosphatase [Clostridium felsineum]URZ05734.1 Phosphoribosyl-ATP pyrophosphatase [Clostridium felsineum]URZ10773.1 Phosphoribosyl-ATP pyrophosphatase [Clostridium felsineum]URZ15527.1 Phosphoribosyl-ATP pyrophosphatase [Clostridium felsineum DSM 794]